MSTTRPPHARTSGPSRSSGPARRRRPVLALLVIAASIVTSLALPWAGTADAAVDGGIPVLTASTAMAARGEPVKLTVLLSARARTAKPSGTVTFLVDGEPLGTATLVSGKAALTTRTLPVGEHQAQVGYDGDANYPQATSSLVSIEVVRGSTTTTVTSRLEPVPSGRTAVLASATRRVAPAAGRLDGTVDFVASEAGGAVVTATVSAGATGSASWRPRLSDGTWTVVAAHGGSVDLEGSTSAPVVVTVGVPPAVVLDQENDGVHDLGGEVIDWDDGTTARAAQTFTAGRTGELVAVDVHAYEFETPQDLVVSVHDVDADGLPAGPARWTGILAAGTVTRAGRFASVPVVGSGQVVAGTRYAIVVSQADPSPVSSYWVVDGTFGDTYAAGQMYLSQGPTGEWVPTEDADLIFRTHVRPA